MDKEAWFKDIADNSGGYLDRLGGSGDFKGRQYLTTKCKPTTKQSEICKMRQIDNNKSPSSAIDDANYIEQRKKRFPKLKNNGESRQAEAPNNDSKIVIVNKIPPRTTRRSLFEMLVGDDVEPEFE